MAYELRKNKSGLPNPFRDYSNFIYPRTIKDVLIWAQYLWERNSRYRTAVKKVVSYFVTDITVTQETDNQAVDTDAVNGFKTLLTDKYDILPMILQFGEELAAMGNVFVSAERIFSRDLVCPKGCGWQMRLKSLKKGRDYEWDGKSFKGTCPSCGKKVTYEVRDSKSQDSNGRRIRFVYRATEDMKIQYNRLTNTYKYLYKIPDDVLDAIKRGDSIYLEDSPKVFLDAAATGEQLIEFPEDSFFSMRTNTLSALDKLYKGWGLPLFMAAFNNIVRMQHLDKFNEAVIMDYLIPTRIISPEAANLTAGADDPNRRSMSGAMFRNFMQAAFKNVKGNPTQTIISPVPVNYQRVGGEKDVIPTELLEYETSQMLSDIGIPQEFRQTNFQTVAPTMGLRFFERQWVHFAKCMATFVKWAADILAHAHQFEDMKCALDMTSFVEDATNKQVQLQLMQAQVIAKTNVLKSYGIDYEDDTKLRIKEQQMEQDAMKEQQDAMQNSQMVQSVMPPAGSLGIGQAQMNIQNMQQAAQAGQPAQPAAPGAPAQPAGAGAPLPFNGNASGSATLEQLFQQAQQTAQELYSAPPNVRRQQLVQLKASNPQMHAMVKQIMTDMAQGVASDAVAQSKMPQG